MELGPRREQRQTAADAAIHTGSLVVQQRAAECPFCALAASHLELLGGELRTPLRVGFDNAGRLDGTNELTLAVENFDFHDGLLFGFPFQLYQATSRRTAWRQQTPWFWRTSK